MRTAVPVKTEPVKHVAFRVPGGALGEWDLFFLWLVLEEDPEMTGLSLMDSLSISGVRPDARGGPRIHISDSPSSGPPGLPVRVSQGPACFSSSERLSAGTRLFPRTADIQHCVSVSAQHVTRHLYNLVIIRSV